MSSPPWPTLRAPLPGVRHIRSCSALPRSLHDLSWREAVYVIQKSESQSYLQERISSIQRKAHAIRSALLAPEDAVDASRRTVGRKRARSATSIRSDWDDSLSDDSFEDELMKVEVAASLPPNVAANWQPNRADVAACLPPDHLDPPPTYLQATQPVHTPLSSATSRSIIQQSPDSELFFQLQRPPVVIELYPSSNFSHNIADPNRLVAPQTTNCANMGHTWGMV